MTTLSIVSILILALSAPLVLCSKPKIDFSRQELIDLLNYKAMVMDPECEGVTMFPYGSGELDALAAERKFQHVSSVCASRNMDACTKLYFTKINEPSLPRPSVDPVYFDLALIQLIIPKYHSLLGKLFIIVNNGVIPEHVAKVFNPYVLKRLEGKSLSEEEKAKVSKRYLPASFAAAPKVEEEKVVVAEPAVEVKDEAAPAAEPVQA
jgi:hypothetical protein